MAGITSAMRNSYKGAKFKNSRAGSAACSVRFPSDIPQRTQVGLLDIALHPAFDEIPSPQRAATRSTTTGLSTGRIVGDRLRDVRQPALPYANQTHFGGASTTRASCTSLPAINQERPERELPEREGTPALR